MRDRCRIYRGLDPVRDTATEPDPCPPSGIPDPTDFASAFSTLVLPQVVLTIANAILATSLLTKDLFSADVPPKKLSTTIGLMNLTSVPFGGFPMCHGAGGLAGQYRYGARTGGANIFAGLIFIVLALFFTSPQVLSIIAVGVLGALLVFVGIEMGRHSLKSDSVVVTDYHRGPGACEFNYPCVHRRDGHRVPFRMARKGTRSGEMLDN